MCPQHVSDDHSRAMINSMPEPALVCFLANKTPHFINFYGFNFMARNQHLAGIQLLDGQMVDVLELRRFFLTLQARWWD